MRKEVTKKTHLTLHLMVHLIVHLSVPLRIPLKVHLKEHLQVYLGDLYKNAREGVFEVKIKAAPEVTIELHLSMYMVVLLLVYKRAQNDSIKI